MSIQTEINQETIVEFDRETYEDICKELKSLLTTEKEVAKRKDELKKAILYLSGGNRMEYGIKIQQRVTKGTIDYKSIVSDMGFSEEEAESYRKETRTYWDVRSY